MSYFAIRDSVGNDYCVTIGDASYATAFRKHAAWWIRQMRRPSAETRQQYDRSPKGMPCFPVHVVVEHDNTGTED